MYTGLYAANPVYWGGPGVVTKEVVVDANCVPEAEPVAGGAIVVCPSGP